MVPSGPIGAHIYESEIIEAASAFLDLGRSLIKAINR